MRLHNRIILLKNRFKRKKKEFEIELYDQINRQTLRYIILIYNLSNDSVENKKNIVINFRPYESNCINILCTIHLPFLREYTCILIKGYMRFKFISSIELSIILN